VDADKARQLLDRERDRLKLELNELRTGGRNDGELSDVDQHTADVGTELFDEERDQSLIRRLEDDLAAIERALKRLDDGSYGRSVDSGEPIPDDRLEAVPWAERTVEEQSRYEAMRRSP
jgi:RNA polymerase-binding transcription factor